MTIYERSAIIGYYRNGMPNYMIAEIMGIPGSYVILIIDEYFMIEEFLKRKLNSST